MFRCLQLILDHGGSVLLADHSGLTPLHCAALNGHSNCCQILLQRGARIDAVTNVSQTINL